MRTKKKKNKTKQNKTNHETEEEKNREKRKPISYLLVTETGNNIIRGVLSFFLFFSFFLKRMCVHSEAHIIFAKLLVFLFFFSLGYI